VWTEISIYDVHKGRNSGILICITLGVPIKVDYSVAYTLGHYSKQLLVHVDLTGLMHGLKVKYMMHIKVETEEYYLVLPSE